METSKKTYAIRCTTEEQARECRENGFQCVGLSWRGKTIQDIKIITYEEALSLGLLGEKKGECLSEDKEVGTPYMDYLERKESPSEDIVEKIEIRKRELEDMIEKKDPENTYGPRFAIRELDKILKHLSSK